MPQTVYRRKIIGDMSGVAVNIPLDTTGTLQPSIGAGVVALAGRFTRGRVDKPFLVDKSKIREKLGKPASMRINQTNEAYVQAYEACLRGASGLVVSRIVSELAKNKWFVVRSGTDENPISLSDTKPASMDAKTAFAFQLKNCINEGVYIEFNFNRETQRASVIIKDRELVQHGGLKVDTPNGGTLYEFDGSIRVDAKNDYGESDFIGDNATLYYGDEIEFIVNPNLTEDSAPLTFGTGNPTTFKSGFGYAYFTDLGTPKAADYQRAAEALGNTSAQYNTIIAATESTALIQALGEVAIQYNRRLMIDIDGKLSPEAAIAWKKQFNFGAQEGMYLSWIWSPISRVDPTGASGNMVFGTSGMRAGYKSAQNLNLNALGLPPLQQPIAGKNFMLSGVNLVQQYMPTDSELAALAQEHIIPVLYQEYDDGAGYVWNDSLTGAKKSGISKLESASDISIWAQETWGKFAKGLEQTPMSEAITKATQFTVKTLQMMEASKWLTPSKALGGATYSYIIQPNERYPEDRLEIEISLAINGVVRRVTINQRLYSAA